MAVGTLCLNNITRLNVIVVIAVSDRQMVSKKIGVSRKIYILKVSGGQNKFGQPWTEENRPKHEQMARSYRVIILPDFKGL